MRCGPRESISHARLVGAQLIDDVMVRLLAAEDTQERGRHRELMEKHHYLKSDILVGEQLQYVAKVNGQWVALVSWSAAANHLKDREQWLGWSITQRRRRLARGCQQREIPHSS